MVSVSVRYLFYQPVDEKSRTWPLRFPAKETPNMGKTLFEWQIVLERFSDDLEMKTHEQNRSIKRTEIKRFDWFIERIQMRVRWLFVG